MEQLHYIIISAVIAIIVILQLWFFLETIKKTDAFKNIFPETLNSYTYENYEIIALHNNFVLREIRSSINNYLVKNKGTVCDFHLIKDIVDRNCDIKEEEINTQIPVPLYLGLMGTMAGILVGVGFLIITGGLDALLSSSDSLAEGANGVKTLMGGVALAMISSIFGILFTTLGSNRAKNAKKNIEKNKNIFLSWIQSELLPNVSSDVSSALAQMTRNLSKFNSTFSSNTEDLRTTLENVNESYRNQAEILKTINQLKIKDIASANIEIYDKLKNCTDEIGILGDYLENVKIYLTDIHQSIEKIGIYFDKETNQIDERKGILSKAVGIIDNELQEFISAIKENAETQIDDLKKSTVRQTDALKQAIEQQQIALNKKLEETSVIVSELKNLTAVRTSMDNLVQAANIQNHKIDNLARYISELAETQTGERFSIPKWVKILFITGFGVISLSCCVFLVKELLDVLDKLFPL